MNNIIENENITSLYNDIADVIKIQKSKCDEYAIVYKKPKIVRISEDVANHYNIANISVTRFTIKGLEFIVDKSLPYKEIILY